MTNTEDAKAAALALDVSRVQRILQVTKILELCCKVTGMGFSAVARVTDEVWMTCATLDLVGFGLKPGDHLPLQSTICDEIRQHHKVVVFDDAAEDSTFRDHHTPRIYGLKSYISVPIITADGAFYGTLCAIDATAKRVNTPEIIGMFQMFADLIASQLAAQAFAEQTEQALRAERETAQLREQFIAVVGHDLRNPLAAILSGLRLIGKRPEDVPKVSGVMREAAQRMTSIVANLMDLARGRLGGGIVAERQEGVDFTALLTGTVAELRSFVTQEIVLRCDVTRPVSCDPLRMGQLLSNLLGNALTHGTPGTPVMVEAGCDADSLTVTITNKGQLPEGETTALFEPFRRGGAEGKDGLGLGLFISAEIAKAHGGTLDARATGDQVVFTLRFPG